MTDNADGTDGDGFEFGRLSIADNGGDEAKDDEFTWEDEFPEATAWGEQDGAEVRVRTVSDDGTATIPKRFHLVEPASGIKQILDDAAAGERFAVCNAICDAPDLTERWEQLTEREQTVLFIQCLRFVGAEDFLEAAQ